MGPDEYEAIHQESSATDIVNLNSYDISFLAKTGNPKSARCSKLIVGYEVANERAETSTEF